MIINPNEQPPDTDIYARDRLVVISGCSSGGKSTLLTELGQRGFATIQEPGRRIVQEELLGDGRALPWVDETAFARRAITLALADLPKLAILAAGYSSIRA